MRGEKERESETGEGRKGVGWGESYEMGSTPKCMQDLCVISVCSRKVST